MAQKSIHILRIVQRGKKEVVSVRTREDILPSNFGIPASKRQDILMDVAALHTAEHGGPEGAVPHDLQLHAAADGLGNAVCPA